MPYESTQKNVQVGEHLSREEALKLAKELNISDFKSFKGWLHH